MFAKSELKNLALEYGKKFLFPDFTNKLTWFVAGIGGAVILTPTPLKFIIYNWLVDSANLNSGSRFTLAELKPDAADYWVGVALIIGALLHNVANRYLIYKEQRSSLPRASGQSNQIDKELFKKFLEDFPSNSGSIDMLRQQDFSNSFNITRLANLEKFVDEWDTVEREFLNTDLERMRRELWEVCYTFNYKLSMGAYDLNGGPVFSCIPDAYRGTGNWPKHVDEKIDELNGLSTTCFKLYEEFVRFGRKSLAENI